jgi:hypothetical protein
VGKTPWTFQNVLKDAIIGECTDVSKEGEPLEEDAPLDVEGDDVPGEVEPEDALRARGGELREKVPLRRT